MPLTGSSKVPGLEAVCAQKALFKIIIEIVIKSVSSYVWKSILANIAILPVFFSTYQTPALFFYNKNT